VPRNDQVLDDEPLGWGLQLAHRAALTLIALSTLLLLVVLLKEKVVDRLALSSQPIVVESPRACSPIESRCPMVQLAR
jgi:hypothetical protein